MPGVFQEFEEDETKRFYLYIFENFFEEISIYHKIRNFEKRISA